MLQPKFSSGDFDRVITYIEPTRTVVDTELELFLFPLVPQALETGWDGRAPAELFDSITDFILICAPDYTIKKANDAAISVFGSSDEIEGKKCYSVLRDRSEPCDNCPLPQTLAQKKVIPAEHYDPHDLLSQRAGSGDDPEQKTASAGAYGVRYCTSAD